MSEQEHDTDSKDGVQVACKVSKPPEDEFVDCQKKLLKEGDTVLVTRKKEKKWWSVTFVTRKGNKVTKRLPINYEIKGRVREINQVQEKGEKINEILVQITRIPKKMNLPSRLVIHQRITDKQIL